MKQLVFTIKTSLILILSVIAFSCCQQEDVQESSTYANMRYLSLPTRVMDNPSTCTNGDFSIINEAIARVTEVKGKDLYINVKSAKEANISEDLFSFIKDLVSTNLSTRAGEYNNDCVPNTIAYLYTYRNSSELPPEESEMYYDIHYTISKYIEKKYGYNGIPWDDFGEIYESLLKKCFGDCQKERFLRDSYKNGSKRSPQEYDLIGVISTTSENMLHSIIIKYMDKGVAIYYDPNSKNIKSCPTSIIKCLYYVRFPKRNIVELMVSLNK